jgi:hypothetical protein
MHAASREILFCDDISESLEVWLRLFFKIIFILKYIKIIFFKKKLFLRLVHQNHSKHIKKFNFL